MLEFLLHKESHIAGNKLTMADLLTFSELKELDLIKFDFSTYPHVHKWMQSMKSVPHYDEVFSVLDKLSSGIVN